MDGPMPEALNPKLKHVKPQAQPYRIWLWVYYDKIPIYPRFYLLKEDYNPNSRSGAWRH